jgi:hypothetical protein
MRKLSASAGLGLGRSGTEPLKLGLGGGGKESALKAVVKQLEETLKAKDAQNTVSGRPNSAPGLKTSSSGASKSSSGGLGAISGAGVSLRKPENDLGQTSLLTQFSASGRSCLSV